MNKDELKQFLESRGYKVKSIRVFKKSFHVTAHTPEVKLTWYFRVPLDKIKQDWSSPLWREFRACFPIEKEMRKNERVKL